ncbi:MAG: prepilin-type N-terminal cleavage/methylation domain-containing protein [Gammaproteobacteria bacterium]|jgi:prepilin-type N-terminal cleavage/methylation domain-containing protein|nr:prepilin-type N-terminal cleavage/methylation domain-containing protein [Gammaproteobacteria bacterium]MBT3725240.1 prepilin-type N-terminal cleavage/methylation domain-containing protein [Gammaproteobacteria bacterium]MBT4195188.1 prepilin-type N-terminal cleavage/methylation domain-containing protein [Gammaproteobacteria bacterium]MBT4449876.1 prepilin-type N-terminal cleavage/methylation domain-containing protein [Gammaproteobacteria bacterium]MBT4863417.1 prepilin-type N-terminal cleavag
MKNIFFRQGFTLVEMLVSIVLSSIIFISSYQVISNLIQYQVRSRVHNEVQFDKLLLTNLVSQIIEKSLHQNDLFFQTQRKSLFKGLENSIQLISRAYSRNFDVAGYRVYRLFLHDDELYVSYRKFDSEYLSNRQFEISTGIKVEDISFQYLSADGWLDEWQDNKKFPKFIKIIVELPGSKIMEWIRRTGRK